MKKLLFLVPIALLSACLSSPKAIIEAEIAGAENQMVYLSEALGYDARELTVTDSIMLVDGKFTLILDDATPRRATINFPKSKRYTSLVIEEGTQIIKADFDKRGGFSIHGTFIADKINELKAKQRPYVSKQLEYSEELRLARSKYKKEGLSSSEIEKKVAPLRAFSPLYKDSVNQVASAMIKENKDNLFAVYQNTIGNPQTVKNIDAVIAKIPLDLRDNGFYYFLERQRAAFAKVDKGAIAPDFTMQTIDGEDFILSSLRGKVVLINTWASS